MIVSTYDSRHLGSDEIKDFLGGTVFGGRGLVALEEVPGMEEQVAFPLNSTGSGRTEAANPVEEPDIPPLRVEQNLASDAGIGVEMGI